MSESRTNVEIEDVLSSIRRLVSQDSAVAMRPEPSHGAAALRADTRQSDEPGCLVLTPALRVSEPEDPANVAWREPRGPEPEIVTEHRWRAPHDLSDAPEQKAWRPVAPHERANVAPMDAEPLLREAGEAMQAQAELETQKPERATSGVLNLGAELEFLESRLSEMQAAVGQAEGFEPEEGDPFSAEGIEPLEVLPDAFDVEAARLLAPSSDETPPQENEVEPAPDHAQEWVDPSDELNELDWGAEAADAEAAAVAPAAAAGLRRLHLADAQSPPQAAPTHRSSYDELCDEVVDEALDAERLFAEPDEAVIDEEALRVVVAEIVRQELQGALGERITRSVRKLVRREIQRALASRDLE
jgi:hypothetical protein